MPVLVLPRMKSQSIFIYLFFHDSSRHFKKNNSYSSLLHITAVHSDYSCPLLNKIIKLLIVLMNYKAL